MNLTEFFNFFDLKLLFLISFLLNALIYIIYKNKLVTSCCGIIDYNIVNNIPAILLFTSYIYIQMISEISDTNNKIIQKILCSLSILYFLYICNSCVLV